MSNPENEPLYLIAFILAVVLLTGVCRCNYTWGGRDAREDICNAKALYCPVEVKLP